MAKYKEYDYSQGKFIPLSFDKQILPGTFEHTLHYLIDNEIDLSVFDLRYKNDETGAPAYDPRIFVYNGMADLFAVWQQGQGQNDFDDAAGIAVSFN